MTETAHFVESEYFKRLLFDAHFLAGMSPAIVSTEYNKYVSILKKKHNDLWQILISLYNIYTNLIRPAENYDPQKESEIQNQLGLDRFGEIASSLFFNYAADIRTLNEANRTIYIEYVAIMELLFGKEWRQVIMIDLNRAFITQQMQTWGLQRWRKSLHILHKTLRDFNIESIIAKLNAYFDEVEEEYFENLF